MSSEKKEYMEIDICKGPIIDRLGENFWVKKKSYLYTDRTHFILLKTKKRDPHLGHILAE